MDWIHYTIFSHVCPKVSKVGLKPEGLFLTTVTLRPLHLFFRIWGWQGLLRQDKRGGWRGSFLNLVCKAAGFLPKPDSNLRPLAWRVGTQPLGYALPSRVSESLGNCCSLWGLKNCPFDDLFYLHIYLARTFCLVGWPHFLSSAFFLAPLWPPGVASVLIFGEGPRFLLVFFL